MAITNSKTGRMGLFFANPMIAKLDKVEEADTDSISLKGIASKTFILLILTLVGIGLYFILDKYIPVKMMDGEGYSINIIQGGIVLILILIAALNAFLSFKFVRGASFLGSVYSLIQGYSLAFVFEIFGQDISNNEEFRADNTHICYLKDNKYYCGLSETFSYVIGNESTIYRVLEKAVKKGSEIYLYDYFAKITNSTCYKDYTPSTINQDCTSNYKENKVNYKFMEKYATKYKHTYRKGENGNYYWVSSEPVTEE